MAELQKQFKYIYFEQDTENYRHYKTSVWVCRNKRSNDKLGLVKWYAPWRQYCFCPEPYTVFNTGCMSDIQNFIKQLSGRAHRPTGGKE